MAEKTDSTVSEAVMIRAPRSMWSRLARWVLGGAVLTGGGVFAKGLSMGQPAEQAAVPWTTKVEVAEIARAEAHAATADSAELLRKELAGDLALLAQQQQQTNAALQGLQAKIGEVNEKLQRLEISIAASTGRVPQ